MISEERLREVGHASGFGSLYPDAVRFARAVEREARQQALEEAAKVCEGLFSGDDCAAEIRALTKKEEIEK